MESAMTDDQLKQRLKELEEYKLLRDRMAASTRAVSITVGTCFGGTTEVAMRGESGQTLWCVMQPVEVIELIHQLSANIGCHIAVKPREDFASWRQWKATDHMIAGNGWPPFVNDMAPHSQVGANLPPPEQQPGLKLSDDRSTENVMAIEKPKNRRSIKRTAKAA
jgi:hypothetical protein